MIHLKISDHPIDEISTQLSLITSFQDVRPLKGCAGKVDWRYNGLLSHLILTSKFRGIWGDAILIPGQGRIDAQELLWLGVGDSRDLRDSEIPNLLTMIVDRLTLKKCNAFCLSLSDLIPGMFEWRNTVRLLVSILSGREEEIHITLVEKTPFVEDAKKRNMDFAFDVQVQYELAMS